MRGHTAALVCLIVAGLGVLAALLVLLWASTEPGWTPWSAPAISTASAWVAFFGVFAAVIAIIAAYVELRTLFPEQELTVRVERSYIDDYDIDLCRIIFANSKNRALISAYRLEVWVEDEQGRIQAEFTRDVNHRESGGDSDWTRLHGDEINYADFHWVRLRNEPFFPDTQVGSPYIDMSYQESRRAIRWRAIWHTDRSSSTSPLSFDIPPTPTE